MNFSTAGSTFTRDVPDYALMIGNPARQCGWMSRHGHKLENLDENRVMRCPESGLRYKNENGTLHCLDVGDYDPLPEELATGTKSYRQFD